VQNHAVMYEQGRDRRNACEALAQSLLSNLTYSSHRRKLRCTDLLHAEGRVRASVVPESLKTRTSECLIYFVLRCFAVRTVIPKGSRMSNETAALDGELRSDALLCRACQLVNLPGIFDLPRYDDET
jgi:hypothetical protein